MPLARRVSYEKRQVKEEQASKSLTSITSASTHWGRVTHICVSKLTIIGSDNGMSPGRRQAIIWTNAGILLIGPPGTNFSEILIEIHTFSFKKMHLKMSSGKWRPFCLGLNVLRRLCSEHKGGTRPLLGMLMCFKWHCVDNYNINVYDTRWSVSSIQYLIPHTAILLRKIFNTWDTTPHIENAYNVDKLTVRLCVESFSLWYQYFVDSCDFATVLSRVAF